MKKNMNYFLLSLMYVVLLCFSGCGDTNIFGWSHKAGSGSNVSALSADAYAALQSKDYAKALEYYKKILESDPNNSEAIYGFSAATLGDAGLDISTLAANLMKQQSSPSQTSRLSPAIADIAKAPLQASMLPDSIKNNIDKIKAAVDAVLASDKLKKIIKGLADGKISIDNADVNINIAFCLVLRAAIAAYKDGIDFSTDYSQSGAVDDAAIRAAAQDIASAYQRFLVVITALNMDSDAAISKIKTDVKNLYDSLPASVKAAIDLNTDWFKNS